MVRSHWSQHPYTRELYATRSDYREYFDREDLLHIPSMALKLCLSPWTFVTLSDLVADAKLLAEHLPGTIDAVIGVEGTGVIPAGILADRLNVPRYTVFEGAGVVLTLDESLVVVHAPSTLKSVLLVDDTVVTGKTLQGVNDAVRAYFPTAKIERAVIYAHPTGLHHVDRCVCLYPGQHYFEWRWQHSAHTQSYGFDFDGILCHDCPVEFHNDEASYLQFLENAEPLFIPRHRTLTLIATARSERRRELTLAWLARHGLNVTALAMLNEPYHDHASFHAQAAAHKAKHYMESTCALFVESELEQAALINALTGRPVLCPDAERIFPPYATESSLETNAQLLRRVSRCEHRQAAACACQAAVCTFPWRRRQVLLPDCLECQRNANVIER